MTSVIFYPNLRQTMHLVMLKKKITYLLPNQETKKIIQLDDHKGIIPRFPKLTPNPVTSLVMSYKK